IRQLCLQAAAHRRARLHSASAQIQKAPNFAQFESQTLYAADEGQRFDVTFAVPSKASLRPGGSRQQRIALVETNRVNADSSFFGDDSDLHELDCGHDLTPWSIVQSQYLYFPSQSPLRVPSPTSSLSNAHRKRR